MLILSTEEYIALAGREDEESKNRLRWDSAPDAVWEDIVVNHPELKDAVILNKVLPESILRLLASDSDCRIRRHISMKRGLPIDVFDLLAEDIDTGIRAAIARNPKAPVSIVQRLAEDASPFVASAARERLAGIGE